jgi:hypothetical protein
MRKLFALAALLACSIAAAAGGVLLNGAAVTISNCAAGGSGAQSLTEGVYLLTVTTDITFLCSAASGATCASGGTMFPAPWGMLYAVPRGGLSVACRSASSSGNISFTPTGN